MLALGIVDSRLYALTRETNVLEFDSVAQVLTAPDDHDPNRGINVHGLAQSLDAKWPALHRSGAFIQMAQNKFRSLQQSITIQRSSGSASWIFINGPYSRGQASGFGYELDSGQLYAVTLVNDPSNAGHTFDGTWAASDVADEYYIVKDAASMMKIHRMRLDHRGEQSNWQTRLVRRQLVCKQTSDIGAVVKLIPETDDAKCPDLYENYFAYINLAARYIVLPAIQRC